MEWRLYLGRLPGPANKADDLYGPSERRILSQCRILSPEIHVAAAYYQTEKSLECRKCDKFTAQKCPCFPLRHFRKIRGKLETWTEFV